MSFSAEIFKNKLKVLDDSQDSIVSISQWVLFHHRHSKEAATIWSDYVSSIGSIATATIKSPSQKKLSLLYLCNDVVQQARRKRRDEFILDFARVLPKAINFAYVTVEEPIKSKIERLINVWEQRQVFAADDISKMKEAIETAKRNPHPEEESNDKNDPQKKQANNTTNKSGISPELKDLNELYLLLSRLTDISQTNLTQFGIQSKNYLPNDPTLNDSLPAPKAYISKLNGLEKISKVSIRSINDLMSLKSQITESLANLSNSITESLKTDDTKLKIIDDKLIRLNSTREELQEMIDENLNSNDHDNVSDDEEPSPEFEVNTSDNEVYNTSSNNAASHSIKSEEVDDDDDDDNLIPTYDTDDEDDEDSDDHSNNGITAKKMDNDGDIKGKRKRRLSQTPSGGSTPSSLKRVAFSEDIEVKEYETEEQTEIIKIVKSDDDTSDLDVYDSDNEDLDQDFSSHHKDDLELKHEHDREDNDEYDPSLNETSSTVSSSSDHTTDIASILSKLS